MAIKVLINGAFGKMGQIATKAIEEDDELNLVGQTGREYDLRKSILDSNADVVIDFTHPDCVFQNTKTILDSGARPVIGTSGLVPEQVDDLKKIANEKKIGGIIAPNFSLGAILMMKYAREIAQYLPHAEIIEMHHDGKIDSPSGTAIRTAELISNEVKVNEKQYRETIKGSRGARYKDVQIHSVRLPGMLAHQEVIFGNTGETLMLRHDSIDRSCFMTGIKLASHKVMELNRLVYGLEEIVG